MDPVTSEAVEATGRPQKGTAGAGPEGGRPSGVSGTTERVARAGILMIFAALASRILGMVREMVLSHQFGQSGLADVYIQAFAVPDLLFVLLSSGALAAVFVPIFTEFLEKGDRDRAWEFFSNSCTIVGLFVTVMVILGEIFVVPLTRLVNPGFPLAKVMLTADLTRIVLPTQICFFLGSILISVQYSLKQFSIPALGSIIYNLFIIGFGVTLGNPETGLGPAGFSWGALVGAIVGNFLVQLWGIRRAGGHYRPIFNLKDPAVARFGKLLLPIVFTISLPYLDMYVNRYFATYLPGDGAVASLNYANRLMQLPLGILAQASAIVIFPFIASQAARQDMEGLKRSLNMAVRTIVAMTLPASVLMIVLAEPIVRLIYQRGEFLPSDTRHTAPVMVFYCLGIAAWSAQSVLARGFYALQDTKRPMITGSIVTVFFIFLNWVLVGPMQERGLALATTIAATLFAVALFFQLHQRLGGLNGSLIVRSFLKVSLAGALMALPVYGLRLAITRILSPGALDTTALSTGDTVFLVFVCATIGLSIYVALLWALRVDEARFLWDKLGSKLRRR